MSVNEPAFLIKRHPILDVDHWVKNLEPPVENIETPDRLNPTNPNPEFMESLGLAKVNIPHTRELDLMHGEKRRLWDGKEVLFFLFRDKILKSSFNGGSYPGPAVRIPRGVIFHNKTHGHGPPPHTIHWHGIEPTPMNDGVGHCSFEIGEYTYQWQPNHIGTYFYHCHKNTVLHFKAGLYGALIIEPPDAFDSGPGKNPGGYPRRTSANMTAFPQFPGFVGGTLENGDPHAMTVPYDVEALWAIDDISSTWMDIMHDPRAGLAKVGSKPGVNDRFMKADLHDYNPDYFFVTGVNFPGRAGETVELPVAPTVPAALNSGVTGMQITIEAEVNQTILIRLITAGYSHIRVKFPFDVVFIAFDGRSFAIPPYDRYNRPFTLPANQFIDLHTAERKDVLVRTTTPLEGFATIEYHDHRDDSLIFTGLIPIVIR